MSAKHGDGRGYHLELLVAGYIREHDDALDLFMNIPDEIIKVVHNFYPLLVFRFGDHKPGAFKIDEDRMVITGADPSFMSWSCYGHIIYADLGNLHENKNGLNQGIHYWSVKNLNTMPPSCFKSIGVTTQKSDDIIDKEQYGHWIAGGINSFYRGCSNWKSNHIITVRLNCDKWDVTYYDDDKEIKREYISAKKSYYFAMLCCCTPTYCQYQIVETPDHLYANQ